MSRGFESLSCYHTNQLTIKHMENYFIKADKVGEFVAAMYAKGISVSACPKDAELTVTKPSGGYAWIKVIEETSVEELCNMFNESDVF